MENKRNKFNIKEALIRECNRLKEKGDLWDLKYKIKYLEYKVETLECENGLLEKGVEYLTYQVEDLEYDNEQLKNKIMELREKLHKL